MPTPCLTLYPAMGVNPATGYGRVALGVAKGLRAAGVTPLLLPESGAPALVIGYAPAFDAAHVADVPRWSYTMLESDAPAPALVDAINRRCERAFVPCAAAADAYRAAGVRVPLDVLPPGADLFPAPEPAPFPRTRDGFTFLTYSYGDTRKGADLAVKAFLAAFGGDPGYRLRVKAREGWGLSWLTQIQHPRVELVVGLQTEAEWGALLADADCFVFPSRAEGWGLPPREATLAGVPAIVTQWLGMADADRWGIPVPVAHLRASDFPPDNPFNAGRWAEPDYDALVAAMRRAAAQPAAARALALRGRAYLLAHFTWRAVGERLRALLP